MQRVRSKHDSKKKHAFATVQEEDDGDRASGSAFVVNVGDDQLVFDASKFKAKKRVSGQLTNSAIEILNKQPTERSEDELWRLQVRRCGGKMLPRQFLLQFLSTSGLHDFFFRTLSHFCGGGSMFLTRTRYCASSPENYLSHSLQQVVPDVIQPPPLRLFLILSPGTSNTITLLPIYILLLFSIHAHTTSTYFPAISLICLPPSLSAYTIYNYYTVRDSRVHTDAIYYTGYVLISIWHRS